MNFLLTLFYIVIVVLIITSLSILGSLLMIFFGALSIGSLFIHALWPF